MRPLLLQYQLLTEPTLPLATQQTLMETIQAYIKRRRSLEEQKQKVTASEGRKEREDNGAEVRMYQLDSWSKLIIGSGRWQRYRR